MKKSLIAKLVLMLFVLVLIGGMAVACGPKEPDDQTPDDDEPIVEETSLTEELVTVIKSIGPLVTTLNEIEEDSELNADLGIGVSFDFGTNKSGEKIKGEYGLDLKTNLSGQNPQINLALNMKGSDDKTNSVVIAYKNGQGYIKQPITKINTKDGGHDEVGLDLTSMKGSIETIVSGLMYTLSGDSIKDEVDESTGAQISKKGELLNLDFDALGTTIESLLKTIDLSSFIELSTNSETGISKLTITSANARSIIGVVSSMLPANIKGIVNTVINNISSDANGEGLNYIIAEDSDFIFPNIFIEVKSGDAGLEKLSLGIDYEGIGVEDKENNRAALNININKFATSNKTSNAVTVDCPNKDIKSFKLNLEALVPLKDISGELNAYLTGDTMIDKDGVQTSSSTLANGQVILKKSGQPILTTNGFFEGETAYFKFVPTGVEDSAMSYKASIKNRGTTEETINNTINIYALMENSLTNWYNGLKEEKVVEPVDPNAEPELSLMQKIYQMLGGDVDALDNQKDSKAKVDPTEKQMIKALFNKFGDNLLPLFSASQQKELDTYTALINALSDSLSEKLEIAKTIFSEEKKWSEIESGSKWVGTIDLVKEGANNDLLDVVNLFICRGKNAAGEAEPFTVEYLTNVVNRYVALLARTEITENAEIVLYNMAVAELDNELLFWENMYENGYITEEVLKEKRDAHYEGLAFEENKVNGHTAQYFANLVISQFIGYEPENANIETDNYLEALINSGIKGYVSCEKDGGLNGGIGFYYDCNTENGEKTLIDLSGSASIVDKDVATGVYDLGDAEAIAAIKDLTDIKYYADTDNNRGDNLKVIATFDSGIKKLVGLEEDTTWAQYKEVYGFDASNLAGLTYAYEQKKDGDKLLWNKDYENAEDVIMTLLSVLEFYKVNFEG